MVQYCTVGGGRDRAARETERGKSKAARSASCAGLGRGFAASRVYPGRPNACGRSDRESGSCVREEGRVVVELRCIEFVGMFRGKGLFDCFCLPRACLFACLFLCLSSLLISLFISLLLVCCLFLCLPALYTANQSPPLHWARPEQSFSTADHVMEERFQTTARLRYCTGLDYPLSS